MKGRDHCPSQPRKFTRLIHLQIQEGSWETSFITSDIELLLRNRQLASLPQFYQEVFQKLNEQGM